MSTFYERLALVNPRGVCVTLVLMTTTTYQVKGMTCGHCVSAVTSEVSAIAGVSDVQVDLETGTVTVTADQPLSEDTVREAVDEAGYELVS